MTFTVSYGGNYWYTKQDLHRTFVSFGRPNHCPTEILTLTGTLYHMCIRCWLIIFILQKGLSQISFLVELIFLCPVTCILTHLCLSWRRHHVLPNWPYFPSSRPYLPPIWPNFPTIRSILLPSGFIFQLRLICLTLGFVLASLIFLINILPLSRFNLLSFFQ